MQKFRVVLIVALREGVTERQEATSNNQDADERAAPLPSEKFLIHTQLQLGDHKARSLP